MRKKILNMLSMKSWIFTFNNAGNTKTEGWFQADKDLVAGRQISLLELKKH